MARRGWDCENVEVQHTLKCECGECINERSLNIPNFNTFDHFLHNDSSIYHRILHFYMGRIPPWSVFFTSIQLYLQYMEKFHLNFDFGLIFSRSGSQTRLKIFPTALKKFALRPENPAIFKLYAFVKLKS